MIQKFIGAILIFSMSCTGQSSLQEKVVQDGTLIVLTTADYSEISPEVNVEDGQFNTTNQGWIIFDLNVPQAGRYQVKIYGSGHSKATVYLEDYVDNKEARHYKITGQVSFNKNLGYALVDGSPLNIGAHKIKLHIKGAAIIQKITFTLMSVHESSPQTYTQRMEGADWSMVWSDEFNGTEIDTSKWVFDVGNWGWGNDEIQYYTKADQKNARVKEGNLIIEAIKNAQTNIWTSARLTTRGKVSFLYGKIEFRARVPDKKGYWAAGWLLGDSYIDEGSWPYCGEIDILENVGYEIQPLSGDGIAHLSVHTPAYYFKRNNQITSTTLVKDMVGSFHTFTMEWSPNGMTGLIDGVASYVYDKTANDLEWPFYKAHNLIINLAMGGNWGGAQGIDPDLTSQKLIIDYVRVFEKR
jgi:beta-glucanase (GH16 family)